MKNTVFTTILLAGLAAAHNHGHGHKHMHIARDDDVVTLTQEVYVTETTTVWVGATGNANSPAASSVASQAAPSQPAQQPQQERVQAEAAPSSSSQPAPAPAPASSSSKPPAPGPSSPANTGSVSGGHSTKMSYYSPVGAPAACGDNLNDASETVAMPAQFFDNKANCGKKLKITGPAGTFTATVGDLCPGCTDGHLDIPQGFATKIAGSWDALYQAGKLPISWDWA